VKSVHNFTFFNYFDVLLPNFVLPMLCFALPILNIGLPELNIILPTLYFVLPEHNIRLPVIDIELLPNKNITQINNPLFLADRYTSSVIGLVGYIEFILKTYAH
jgi:hypothetical protein